MSSRLNRSWHISSWRRWTATEPDTYDLGSVQLVGGRWTAHFHHDGSKESTTLGEFDTEHEAMRAVDSYVQSHSHNNGDPDSQEDRAAG